jgi:Ca-activated chloride channel family protein
MLSEFHFIRPAWLLMLLPLAWLAWRTWRRSGDANAWRHVVDAHLLPKLLDKTSTSLDPLPRILLAIVWLLLAIALAGPSWQRLPQPVYQAQQFRVIVLDLSLAMNTTDVKPSRLAQARFKVIDLIRQNAEGQIALIAYGAEPYVVAPLTSDGATIAAQVPLLETALLPTTGPPRTDLALGLALDLLQQAGAPDGEVILITYGFDEPERVFIEARRLAAADYRLSVLGVGTAKGAPLPLPGGGFVKNPRGEIVISRLDRESLRAVAGLASGNYVDAQPGNRDIAQLAPPSPTTRRNDNGTGQTAEADQWREEGPLLILLLLPLVALAFRRGWLSPLVVGAVMVTMPVPDAHALSWDDLWLRADQRAMRQLESGDPGRAAEIFQREDWRAAAAYRAGDYQGSLDALEQSPEQTAFYNKGNALARLGRFEDAIAAYQQALDVDPGDVDALFNRDLIQSLLDQQQAQQASQNDQSQDGEPQESQDQESSAASQDETTQQEGQGDDPSTQQSASSGTDSSDDSASDSSNPESVDGAESTAVQAGQQTPAGNPENPSQIDNGEDTAARPDFPEDQDAADRLGEHPQDEDADQRNSAGGNEADNQSQHKDSSNEPAPTEQDASDMSRSSPAPQSGDGLAEGRRPDRADLLGDGQIRGPASQAQAGGQQTEGDRRYGESEQALEQMLRRVDEDPGGLLRQRFLLQHLRRNGQLR